MADPGKNYSYKQAQLAGEWDAIVIGSGIGGLTTAALLAIHGGKRVLVLERHYVAGGFSQSFHRPGYEWDVGLPYIGQVQDERFAVRRAFDHITDGAVLWSAMPEVYDRAVIDGSSFNFTAGIERFREGMKQYSPREGKSIDKYIRMVRAVNRVRGLYYAEKVIPAPAAALGGSLLRAPFLRWAKRTTLEVLETITTNRELIGVLTAQWGDYGQPPSRSSFAIHATIAVEAILNGVFCRSRTNRYRWQLPDIPALSGNGNGAKKDSQNKCLIVSTESSIRRLTASVVANRQSAHWAIQVDQCSRQVAEKPLALIGNASETSLE